MTDNIVDFPMKVEYRQTRNMYTKQWNKPARMYIDKETGKKKWKIVRNLHKVVTRSAGIGWALWRIRTQLEKEVCGSTSIKKWRCTDIKTVRKGQYNIYYFECKRIRHNIMGVL